MITVCKTFEFSAAHNLPNHEGLCKNLHGHTYKLEVEVIGAVRKRGAEKGMIVDFGNLKKIINKVIIDKLDHSLLNKTFDNPTAEEMVQEMSFWIDNEFVAKETTFKLLRLRLWETPTSYAEWRPE